MTKCITSLQPVNEDVRVDKGHGRLEKRSYFHYQIGTPSEHNYDERWSASNFQSLFKVERHRLNLQTGEASLKVDYYISNGKYSKNEDYFSAIRQHWSVEVNNHVRDVTLKEDKLRTKKNEISKLLASCRTLVIKLLQKTKAKNMVEQLELFQDDFTALLLWLKKINFL